MVVEGCSSVETMSNTFNFIDTKRETINDVTNVLFIHNLIHRFKILYHDHRITG